LAWALFERCWVLFMVKDSIHLTLSDFSQPFLWNVVIVMAWIFSMDVHVLNALKNYNLLSHFSCAGRIDSDAPSRYACFFALFCTNFCNFLILFMFFMCSNGWSVLACFLLIFIQILPYLHAMPFALWILLQL